MHQLPRRPRHLIEPPGQLLTFGLAGDGEASIGIFVGIGLIGFKAGDHLVGVDFKLMRHKFEKCQFFTRAHGLVTIENGVGHGYARDLADTAQKSACQIGRTARLRFF